MTSGQGGNHDQPGAHAGEETPDTELTCHLEESGHDALSRCTLGLVNLGQEGVGGLGDDGGGTTCYDTTGEVESLALTTGEGVFGLVGGLENLLDGDFEATVVSTCGYLRAKLRLTRQTWPWCKESA